MIGMAQSSEISRQVDGSNLLQAKMWVMAKDQLPDHMKLSHDGYRDGMLKSFS